MLALFGSVISHSFSNCFREANKSDHHLAKLASHLSPLCIWKEKIVPFIVPYVVNDILNLVSSS